MAIERREQVFVSSTFLDLQEERQAVIQTLLQADCFPAGMELFPASDDEKWKLIQRVIDDSDYYVVVLGARYGSVDEQGLSFTEKEFDYAIATKTPVMGFLHGDPTVISLGKADLDEKARENLENFRTKVGERMVKYWTSPAELAGAVALSLIQLRKTHPSEGWIRSSNALTPEVEREIAQLRERIATQQQELDRDHDASQPAGINLDLLSQGEDQHKMDIRIRYWTEEDTEAGRTTERRGRWHDSHVEVSWNTVFASLAPLLMDESSEMSIDQELDHLANLHISDPPPLPEDAGSFGLIEAGIEAMQDFKVQFFALGLIRQSEKRHPIHDKNTYWSLTQEGRNHMMRLRAVRRPDKKAPETP